MELNLGPLEGPGEDEGEAERALLAPLSVGLTIGDERGVVGLGGGGEGEDEMGE